MVRVAALLCEMLRASDRTDLAGVRVVLFQTGRVTITFMESDGAGRRRDGVTVRRLDGRPADESAETRRVPNLAFTEDSLEPKVR